MWETLEGTRGLGEGHPGEQSLTSPPGPSSPAGGSLWPNPAGAGGEQSPGGNAMRRGQSPGHRAKQGRVENESGEAGGKWKITR